MTEQSQTNGAHTGREIAGGRDSWVVDGFAPLPGDTIRLAGDDRAVAQTVYLCAESNGLQLVRWSWIVLEDGRLLEIAPRGCALYDPPMLLPHGSGEFLELAAQDGALVRFEERVRAGVWQTRPVRLNLGGRRWRLTSTGNVIAQRLGPVPESGWSQLRTRRPGSPLAPTGLSDPPFITHGGAPWPLPATEPVADEQDVYFTLVGQAGQQPEAGTLGLGVWMTDICLAFGRRLGDSPAAAGISVMGEADASTEASA